MLIILEGPDGSGKSTLARQLSRYLEVGTGRMPTPLHAGPPTRHPLDEYLRPLTTYRPGAGEHVIADRWHWGERVYPAALGRATQLDDQSWWYVENYLLRLGAVVVRCVSDFETYERVYSERGESSEITSALAKVISEYSAVNSTLPQVTYCYQQPVHSIEYIIGLAGERALVYGALNNFTTYVGPRWPRYLLFGDIRHQLSTERRAAEAEPHAWVDPAFVPFPSTSGHYLLGALGDAGLLGDVGLANACDEDDPLRLWERLRYPRVVALGRNAARKLERLKLEHTAVPHPQFIRRFYHGKRAEYGALIRQALELQIGDSRWPTSSPAEPVPTSTTAFSS